MRVFTVLQLACAALLLPSCATMIRGTKDDMIVKTDPEGARVTTTLETPKSKRARRKDDSAEREFYGCDATPCAIDMPRKADFLLTIEKDGYEPVTIAVEGKLGKRGLTANIAQGAGALTFAGLTGAWVANFSLLGSASAGAGAGAGAAAATAGVLLVPLGVDAATGSMLNHNPNPIELVLPPVGTGHTPDPYAAVLGARLAKADAYKTLRRCEKQNIQTRKIRCGSVAQTYLDAKAALKEAEVRYEQQLEAAEKAFKTAQKDAAERR